MRAADGYQTYILGSAAAYTLAAQSSSGPTTYDGTAWVAEFMDDYLFGPVNALFYSTAQTYSETAESYTASDWLNALSRFIFRTIYAEKPFVNLVIKNNASTPNSKVDIDCTSIYVGWKKHETVDLTLDITASGALGLDTGTENANAWYYIWLLSKLDGTLTGVLSASATSPTLPSGYIFSKIVGAVRNTSGNFVAFYQKDNEVSQTSILVMNTGGDTSNTAIDISNAIPVSITKTVQLLCAMSRLDGFVYIMPIVPYEYAHGYINLNQIGTFTFSNVPVYSSNLYYRVNAGTVSIYISGYTLNI